MDRASPKVLALLAGLTLVWGTNWSMFHVALSELLATSELAERERGWAVAVKSTAEHLAILASLIVDAA